MQQICGTCSMFRAETGYRGRGSWAACQGCACATVAGLNPSRMSAY